MEEHPRFVARRPDGCREFGLFHKISTRYQQYGCQAFSDRSRRPLGYADHLPLRRESLIVTLKREEASPWPG
jgi:hypothetical protein